jgi:hypothetical protein
MMQKRKNPHAVAMGRIGGSAKSEKKAKSSRRNGLISAIKRQIRREQEAVSPANQTLVDSEPTV